MPQRVVEALLRAAPLSSGVTPEAAIASARAAIAEMDLPTMRRAVNDALDALLAMWTRDPSPPRESGSTKGHPFDDDDSPLATVQSYFIFREGEPSPLHRTPTRHLSSSLYSKEDAAEPHFTAQEHRAAADGAKMVNQYELIHTLGKGTSGKVKLAFDTERNTTVAIKIVRRGRTAGERQKLHREVGVMKRLRHKNLVSLYEVIDDPESDKLYLVMQYVDDGPLVTVDPDTLTCTPMDAAAAAEAARQLTAGLAYLHSHRIVHRDIKPENILKSRDGTVYLADFGVSQEYSDGQTRVSGWEGSPLFMAPEVHALRDASHANVDGYAADVYSLGVTLFLMLTGRLPFTTPGNEARAPLMLPPCVRPPWQRILRGMLHADPDSRMCLADVRRAVKAVSRDNPYDSPTDCVIVTRRPSVIPLPDFRLPTLVPSSEVDSNSLRTAVPRAAAVDALSRVSSGSQDGSTGDLPPASPLKSHSPDHPLRICRSLDVPTFHQPTPPKPARRSLDPPNSARGRGGELPPHGGRGKAAFHHLRPLPSSPN